MKTGRHSAWQMFTGGLLGSVLSCPLLAEFPTLPMSANQLPQHPAAAMHSPVLQPVTPHSNLHIAGQQRGNPATVPHVLYVDQNLIIGAQLAVDQIEGPKKSKFGWHPLAAPAPQAVAHQHPLLPRDDQPAPHNIQDLPSDNEVAGTVTLAATNSQISQEESTSHPLGVSVPRQGISEQPLVASHHGTLPEEQSVSALSQTEQLTKVESTALPLVPPLAVSEVAQSEVDVFSRAAAGIRPIAPQHSFESNALKQALIVTVEPSSPPFVESAGRNQNWSDEQASAPVLIESPHELRQISLEPIGRVPVHRAERSRHGLPLLEDLLK